MSHHGLDSGFEKLSDTMENILRRSEELIELTKLKRKYQNYSDKVDERFIILGKLIYEAYLEKGDMLPRHQHIYREIDDLRTKMKEIAAKIADAENNR